MSAAIRLFSPEELQPEVIIVAKDCDSFSLYPKALDEAGFCCQLLSSVDELFATSQPKGCIVFLSWNLCKHSSKAIAQSIYDQLGYECIVFAESTDVQTAAQLSSCGHSQTIQQPFTSKNFVMAIQTIAKNRQIENEKNIRKQRHQERMQSLQPVQKEEVEEDVSLKFSGPENPEAETSNHFKGEGRSSELSLLQGEGQSQQAQMFEGESPEDPFSAHQHGEDQRQKAQLFGGKRERTELIISSGKMLETDSSRDPSATQSLINKAATKEAGGVLNYQKQEAVPPETYSYQKDKVRPLEAVEAEDETQAAETSPSPQIHSLPHEWMQEPIEYKPAIDRRGAALSAKDIFWMSTAIAVGFALCVVILSQVFFASLS